MEEAAAPRPKGLGWKFWLRIVFSLGLRAVLIRKAPDPDEVLPSQHHVLTGLLLAFAILVTFGGVFLSAWRWKRVLNVFDVDVPLATLTSHYLAGLFVGNVLPSTIGGDVLRVSRVTPACGSSSTAFASVALERMTGFVALPLLVFMGVLLQPSILDVDHAWIPVLIAVATLVILAVILYLAGHPKVAGRFAEHENWMRFIGAVHIGVDRLRREPRQLIPVIGAAILYQASVVLAVGLIFRTLDLGVPIAGIMMYVPAVAMLQVLPITFNGLGVREGALVLFLHPWGVDQRQAIALGLLWFTATLIVSCLGAPAFAVGNRSKRNRAPTEETNR